ncbi:MAG: hypothetical protein AAF585_19115 [Verrucomicrobiota bacterium]
MRNSVAGGNAPGFAAGNMFDDLDKLGGFPIEGVEFENNQRVSVFKTKMTQRDISPSEMQLDSKIPVHDIGAMLKQNQVGIQELLDRMGQGNPFAGSDLRKDVPRIRPTTKPTNTEGGAVAGAGGG